MKETVKHLLTISICLSSLISCTEQPRVIAHNIKVSGGAGLNNEQLIRTMDSYRVRPHAWAFDVHYLDSEVAYKAVGSTSYTNDKVLRMQYSYRDTSSEIKGVPALLPGVDCTFSLENGTATLQTQAPTIAGINRTVQDWDLAGPLAGWYFGHLPGALSLSLASQVSELLDNCSMVNSESEDYYRVQFVLNPSRQATFLFFDAQISSGSAVIRKGDLWPEKVELLGSKGERIFISSNLE